MRMWLRRVAYGSAMLLQKSILHYLLYSHAKVEAKYLYVEIIYLSSS